MPIELESLKASASGNGTETIAIVGTNDLHGTLAPIKIRGQNDVEAAGAPILASYLKLLRSEWGTRLLWLDAGDHLQGSIETRTDQGATMIRFFNQLGLSAATLGDHEFDFGWDVFKARASEARFPYITSNLLDKGANKTVSMPNMEPYTLIQAGRLKVGLIGLTTRDILKVAAADASQKVDSAHFKDVTLRYSKTLRDRGADIVLLVAHLGVSCQKGRVPRGYAVRKATDPQGGCSDSDELVQLLRTVPAGTVDAVVSGHAHSIVHHWVSGVPVIQGGAYGRYFNVIYLTYDLRQRKLLTDLSRVEGPVPLCPAVYANNGDCSGRRESSSMVRPKFHGRVIKPDDETFSLIAPLLQQTQTLKKETVSTLPHSLTHERFKESHFGNLVADALRAEAKTDFALVNNGMIRASLDSGPVRFEELFRAIPYENSFAVLTVTGKELKMILRVTQNGSRGFSSVSGLKLRLIGSDYDAPSTDLDGNSRIEAWEINRLIDAQLPDGKPIKEDKTYTVAIPDFMARGGDDLSWVISNLPWNRVQWRTDRPIRDAVAQYMRSNSSKFQYAEPRLKFEKKPNKGKRRGKRKSKRA